MEIGIFKQKHYKVSMNNDSTRTTANVDHGILQIEKIYEIFPLDPSCINLANTIL